VKFCVINVFIYLFLLDSDNRKIYIKNNIIVSRTARLSRKAVTAALEIKHFRQY